ncbi:unnamed protein product [Thelazia callipaeda]|uniref:BAR domain-containing protein n=1 Tax=Thelazia callipaeda TaxID=103827 RepID=A0A0N5D2Q8_THECL|nr:unnamed protein product [Thelazia callipaeda]
MTTKVKAAAYRLAGGSKTVYGAEYEEKVSTFNSFKKQVDKMVTVVTNLVTDTFVTEIKQKIVRDSADSSMNKFEKLGQALYKYSLQIDDRSCAGVLQTAKNVLDKAGQEHRSFRTDIIERVQKPMKEWIDVNAKNVSKELKAVDNRRDELDCAVNKLRKKADDPEVKARKEQAENAFNEELERADKLLDDEIKQSQSVVSSAMIAYMEVVEGYNGRMKNIFKVPSFNA